MNVPEHKT